MINCAVLIVVNAIIESPNWLVLAGLVFDILGVGLIAWGMVASKSKIVEQLEPAPTDWMRKSSYTVEKSAGYLDRLWQSRTALGGPVLLAVGFGMQAVGTYVQI